MQSLARGEAEISGKGNQEEAEASDGRFHQPQSRGATFGSRTRDGALCPLLCRLCQPPSCQHQAGLPGSASSTLRSVRKFSSSVCPDQQLSMSAFTGVLGTLLGFGNRDERKLKKGEERESEGNSLTLINPCHETSIVILWSQETGSESQVQGYLRAEAPPQPGYHTRIRQEKEKPKGKAVEGMAVEGGKRDRVTDRGGHPELPGTLGSVSPRQHGRGHTRKFKSLGPTRGRGEQRPGPSRGGETSLPELARWPALCTAGATSHILGVRTRQPARAHRATERAQPGTESAPPGLAGAPQGDNGTRPASLPARRQNALLTVHLGGASASREAASPAASPRRRRPFIHSRVGGWRRAAEAGAERETERVRERELGSNARGQGPGAARPFSSRG
uniref:Uncharacterized protein n=1 Tax=Rangifer tarandus platyrhynchus TaxID=3082113 RepID=A0ACB0F178_RANTA|nr:unnamed protein product [Rangifer tarandus platyrhynchus]